MKNNKWELLGHASVDSGQLLLIDPSYLAQWDHDDHFEDIRIYRHKETGARLQYRVHFENFQSLLPKYGNRTMNQLIETGEWEELPLPVPEGLSYNSVCLTTLGEKGGGEVDLGVAFSTGWGDGHYPVKVQRNGEGRIMRVLIEFGDDAEG